MYYKKLKNKKGFALILALLILLSLSLMSIAMMDMVQKNSRTTVASSQNITTNHAAEAAVEAGRLWLLDQLTISGTDAIIITNRNSESVSGRCLGHHGYTDNTENVFFAKKSTNINFAAATEANFGRYTYTYYVQRIGYQTTKNGYNLIRQSTTSADNLYNGLINNRAIFYRVLGCGYGPNTNFISTLQGFFSASADTGNADNNKDARNVLTEGYSKP